MERRGRCQPCMASRRFSRRLDYLPSIAILPLENLSEDGVSDYFSEGVVEDVIVSLAGLRELRVISRGSTLGYPSGRTMFGKWVECWTFDTCFRVAFDDRPRRSGPQSS